MAGARGIARGLRIAAEVAFDCKAWIRRASALLCAKVSGVALVEKKGPMSPGGVKSSSWRRAFSEGGAN